MWTKIQWSCLNCEKETTVEVSPGHRGSTRGHPDTWYPPEPGEYEPDKCAHCGAAIEYEDIMEAAFGE